MAPKNAPPKKQIPVTEDIQKRTIWQSFSVLPAQTRLKISLAVTAFAVSGIFISDQLEKILPPPPPSKSSSSSPSAST